MPEMDEIVNESRYYFTLSNYNVTTSRKPSYEYDGDLTGKFNYYNQRGEGMKGLLFGPKDTEVYLDVLNEKHESISTKMHAEKSKKDEGKVENVCALSHFPHKLRTNESGLCDFTCRIHHETCEKCSCMVFLLRLSWRTGPNEFDSIMSTPFSVSVKEAKESDKKLSEKKAAVVSSQESELDSQCLSQGPSQLSPPRVAVESTCFTSYYTFKTFGCLDSVTRYSDNSEHNVTQFILPSKENIWELCTFFKLRKDVSFETDVPSKYYSGYNRAVAQERKNSAKSVAPLSTNGHSSSGGSRNRPLSSVAVKSEVKNELMTAINTPSVYTTTAATNNNSAGTSDSRVIAEFKSQIYNLLVNFTGEVLQSRHLGDITVKECEDLLRQMPSICQHATIQVQNNYVEQISKSNCFTPVSMGNSSAKTVVNKHRESEHKFYDSGGTPRTTQMFEKSAPSLVTQSSSSNLGAGNTARTPRTYSVTEDNELRHINGTPSRSLQCTPQTTERKKRTATDPPEPDSYYVQNACMVRERDNSSVQSDTSNSRRKLSNESSTPSRNFITREDSQRSVASMTSQDLQASPYTPVMKLTAGMVRANLNSVGRSGSASYNPNSLSGNSLNAMYNNGTNSHNNSGYSVYGMSHSNNSVQQQQNNQQNSQQNNQIQFIPNSINNNNYSNNIINNPFSNNNTPHQKSSSSNTLSTLTIQIPDLQLPPTVLGVDKETQTETETPMEKVPTGNAATQTRAHRVQLNPIDLVVDTRFNSTSPIIISHPMRGTGTSPFDSNSSSPQLSPLGSNGANGGTIGANKLSAFGAATNFSAGSPGVSGSVVRKNPTLQPIKHSDSPSNTSHISCGSGNNSAKSSTKISNSTKIGSGSRMAPLPLTQQEYAVEASEALPLQHQRRSTSYNTISSNNADSNALHGSNNSSGSSNSAAPMLRSSTVCLTGPAQQLVSPQKKASSTAMSKKLRDAQQFAATTEDRSELRDRSHFFGAVSGSCETVEAGNNNISRNSSHQYHSGDDSFQNSNHNNSSFINHTVFERMEGVGDSGEWLGLSKAIGNSLASEDDYGDHRGSGVLGVTSNDHIPSNLFSSGDFLDGIGGAAAQEEQEARGFAQNLIPFPLLEADASSHMSMAEDQQLEGEQRDQQRRHFYGHHDGAYELFTMDELSQDLTHSTINQKM